MLISPITAIENGWISHPLCKSIDDWRQRKFISPNAIDFTVDKIWTIDNTKFFVIDEEYKSMRGGEEMEVGSHSTVNQDADEHTITGWAVSAHHVYDILSDMRVDIPEGIACTLIIRSTYSRNGLYLTSGIFDSGYQGNIGAALHVKVGPALIGQGTRIGQIAFHSSDSAGIYAGGYNHEQGTHWSSSK